MNYNPMRFLAFLLTGTCFLLITACSSNDEKEETVSLESELYETAQDQLEHRRWTQAINNLQTLEEHFPFGKHAEQAQLELVYAHFGAGDPDSSTASADRFIRLHPQHRNVDYAYYMKGLSAYVKDKDFISSIIATDRSTRDPGAARESLTLFTQLLHRYPESAYAADAQKHILALRNLLARYEINVANYYFKRGAYLASINRGRYVLENFQGSPAVPDALAVMVQGYHLIDMDELATRTESVLKLNYPDHPALNDDDEFNYQYAANTGADSWLSKLTFGFFDKTEPKGFDTRQQYDPSLQNAPRVSE